MKHSHQRGDIRTWLLLVLALVPTWSVLGGAGWLWNERGEEISDFEMSQVPIHTTYELFVVSSKMFRAEASLRAAALPDATPEAITRATQDVDDAVVALDRADDILLPLIDSLAPERDMLRDPEVLSLIGNSMSVAIDLFEQQVVGEPVSLQIDFLGALARDTASGLVLPFSSSANQNAVYFYDALAATIKYHDQFDRDRAVLIARTDERALFVADTVASTVAVRASEWKDVVDSRTFVPLVANVDWAGTVADPVNPVLLDTTEPLGSALADAYTLETPADRDQLFLEIQAIDDALQADVDLAYRHVREQSDAFLATLVRDRRLLGVTSALMAVLGVSLAALTISEVRRRRSVEAAHDDAVAQLSEKADRDPTTGAWNRRRLEASVERMIHEAPEIDEIVVLAYLDLDHFKAINDVWGHSTGDVVLRTVTERLHQFTYLGAEFELCRFGGDEFVLFAQMPKRSLVWLEGLGETIIQAVDTEMDADGRKHEVGVSVGIATSTEDSTYDSLLLEADSSLLLAKQERGSAVVYNRDISRTGELVHAFPDALANGEICVHMQPVVDARTGEVAHIEALARWQRPNGESVSPGVFIPLVESYGLAEKLTMTVLGCVGDIIDDPSTPDDMRVWINVSPRELDVANFAKRFVALLHQIDVPPKRIGLEITETAAVRDPARLAIEMHRLRAVGICIAIDDFGNGYSPLGYLRQLPANIVKLDRSLISFIDTDAANQHIVVGIVGLVHQLGMDIVAEGVERIEEQRWLVEHGVHMIQGFLFDRPAPPETFSWHRRNAREIEPVA